MRFTLCCVMPVMALCSCAHKAETRMAWLDIDSQEVLVLPPLSPGAPAAGKRVKVTPPEYTGTEVFHTVYLPETWEKGGPRLPIIFEYTGNFYPVAGSTGEPAWMAGEFAVKRKFCPNRGSACRLPGPGRASVSEMQ